MNKNIILAILSSLVIAILISIEAINTSFLIGSIIGSFILLLLIFWLFDKRKKENKKRYTFFGILLVIVVVLWALFVNIVGICIMRFSDKVHFRTNIITNKCDVSINSCHPKEVWYQRVGCNISRDKTIDLIKQNKNLDKIITECQQFCKDNTQEYNDFYKYSLEDRFCVSNWFLPENVYCDDLTTCSSIANCGDYRQAVKERAKATCSTNQECVDLGLSCTKGRVPTCVKINAYNGEPLDLPKCYCE